MATITLWVGSKSFITGGEYKQVTVEGEELATVRFSDEVLVRVVKAEDGKVIVNYIEREGYDVRSDVFEYADLNEAAVYERFVLRRAGIIK